MKKEYDIIIVGGGMVGAALACLLGKQTSLSIAVLEAQPLATTWTASTYHHRVSAISHASKHLFESIDVWNAIKHKRISPFTHMQVWEAINHSEIKFDCHEIAATALGYIIENEVIQTSLHEKLQSYSPRIQVISPVKLTEYLEASNGVELTADDGNIYSARLVVAADGARSWLRDQAGIVLHEQDYEQHAIVGTVTTTLAHEQTARQIFLDTGPLAFLPLAESNQSSIVWSLPIAEAKRLMEVDIDTFKLELAQAFEYRLGDVVAVDQRMSFPLRRQQADCYVKGKVVLVGDAAHTIHPLAGQGVNLGLQDAVSLAEVIVEAMKNRRDYASAHVLRRYERCRRAENVTMLQGVDVIKQLFASDNQTIQRLLSFGLNTTNRLSWLKNFFVRYATS